MEKTEKKTAEDIKIDDILQIYLPDDYYEEIRNKLIPLVRKYAAQELADYKARLKELIKERIDKHENNFYDNVNDSHAFGKLSECRYLLELIDKL